MAQGQLCRTRERTRQGRGRRGGMTGTASLWPRLAYEDWSDTALTLQLWMQIVGKIRLRQTPWLNHSWQVPYYVSARGLTTSPIPVGDELLELEFDFLAHRLVARTSDGRDRIVALQPLSVADFYAKICDLLRSMGLEIVISAKPSEIPDAIPFASDTI